MGGADQAHVHRFFRHAAQRAYPPLLDHAQQLGLHGQGQVTDFVEEQGATLGRLEVALAVLRRAGVGAFARAEELGFDQVLGDGAAVDRHEGAARAVAAFVHRTGHQLLAGPRFAQDEHRRHAGGHLFDAVTDLFHAGRAADDASQRLHAARWRRCGPQWRARRVHLCGRWMALALQCGAHGGPQLLEIDRFGQVVEGAALECFDRVLGRAVGGDDDRFLAALACVQFAQQLQAQAIGQPHVGDQQVEALLRQRFARLRQVGGRRDFVAFPQQGQFVERAQVRFVVDDQDGRGGRCGHGLRTAWTWGADARPRAAGSGPAVRWPGISAASAGPARRGAGPRA